MSNITIRPVIKWSGSKRSQVNKILEYVPEFDTYYEPFVGGGSIMYGISPDKAVCSDISAPLIELWELIKNNPLELSKDYEKKWKLMKKEGHQVYYDIRDSFNETFTGYDLLFLSRTCVNGMIRFNLKGEFNNSLHHNRDGIKPETLKKIIFDWSEKIKDIEFKNVDYKEATKNATKNDFIYLDPPYFNTKGRYYGLNTIDFDEFYLYLEDLNKRKIKFILSFDGITNKKDYSVDLPKHLYKRHIHIHSGNSSFDQVMNGEKNKVYESLYLSW